jgi:hypothetical protein
VASQERSDPQQLRLHRCAVAASVWSLLGIVSGAIVTSGGVTSGAVAGNFLYLHQTVALLESLVSLMLAIWMIVKQPARLGWVLLATLLAEGALGSFQSNPGLAVLHACLGQILLALTVAAAVVTSAAWTKEPDVVEDHGWPSLGSLGRITPVFVFGQIALGAAFRHKALGVMPHLVGAMVIVMLILCICIFVMQQFPAHKTLRPGANFLMAIAFTQIFLGIAAFTVRTMSTISAPVVIAVTSAHASVGALTLAAAVILHMQIHRNVRPHREEEEEAGQSSS